MKQKKEISAVKVGMSRDQNQSDLKNVQYTLASNVNTSSEQEGFNLNLEPSNHFAVDFKILGNNLYKVVGFKTDLLKERTYYFLTNTTEDINSLHYKRSSVGYVDNNNAYNINYNNTETTQVCDDCGKDNYKTLVEPLEEAVQVPSLEYVELFNDKCLSVLEGLNFNINSPIKKIEINQEKLGTTLYFNDYNNAPRYINVTNIETKGALSYIYEEDLVCDDPTYSTCINVDKLLIFPKHNRISIEAKEQQLGGNLKMGTYEFYAAYCDIVGNEMTQYCSPTNPISIFDENNNIQAQTTTDDFTNFAIKLKVNDLDVRGFKYYKVVVVERNNVSNTQSVFLAGIYPTTDDTIIYTSSGSNNDDLYVSRGNVSIKKRMDFATLNAIKPTWKKAKGTMVSGDTLWHYGIEAEEEINLQPVVNLIGGLVHWASSASSENLYKSSIATSKYKGYPRGEVQALAIRLTYTNGGYSANFPLVARPHVGDEKSVLTSDTNLNSLRSSNSSCSTVDRSQKWQVYNTATVFEQQCSNITEGATIIESEISKECIIENVATILQNSVVLSSDIEFYTLIDHINDNYDIVTDINSSDYIPEIAPFLTANYSQTCLPSFIGDCSNPILIESINKIAEVKAEIVEKILKQDSEYLPSVPPSITNIFRRNTTDANFIEDDLFMNNYMDCQGSSRRKVYIRDSNFYNEICNYALSLPVQADPISNGEGVFLNVYGAISEIDLLQNNYNVHASAINANFKNKLHKGAQFFKAQKREDNKFVLEITKSSNCESLGEELNYSNSIRYTIYQSCANLTVLAGGIVDMSQGLIRTIDTTNYPNTFIIAIDAPLIVESIDENCGLTSSQKTVYKVIPTCGSFSIYSRELENAQIRVSWEEIKISKVITYEATCKSVIPQVNDCDPIPYKKGRTAYWESTEEYPDNKQLWDSSNIKIKPSDLNLLSVTDRLEFTAYYTNNNVVDVNNNYILKNADFRCQPIRHYKLPDNTVSPYIIDSLDFKDNADTIIFPLGFELDSKVVQTAINIAYTNGLITKKQRDNIQGYEILRGDNSVSKSIVASGIAFDYYKYTKEKEVFHFPNFPFNDLGRNKFCLDAPNGKPLEHPYNSNSNHLYSFLSPDIFLTKPTLPTEVSLQGFVFGSASTSFTDVDKHSEWTVLGDKARRTADRLGLAEATLEFLIKSTESAGSQFFLFGLANGANAGLIASGILAGLQLVSGAFKVGKYRYSWLLIFRDLGRIDNFASMQVGVGNYNKFLKVDQYSNDYLRTLASKKHLKEGEFNIVDENDGTTVKVNNWLREHSVFLSTGKDYPFNYGSYTDYKNYDNNKTSSTSSNFLSSEVNCSSDVKSDRDVASPYFTLKNYIPDQWGGIGSIKWLTTNYIFDIQENTECKVIYGGTSVISRFSWRRKTPIFRKNAIKIANKIPFMYSKYDNIGYPAYFCDYETGDDDGFKKFLGIPFPDIVSNTRFDCENGRRSMYFKPPSKFYLFVHGIVDFLVESEINCNFRYAKKEPADWFYPQHQDLSTWLQDTNVSIAEPNTFYYNNAYTLPVSNSPFKILDTTYDKDVWAKRTTQLNAIAWSQKDINENDLTNPWLVYKPLDWYEFKTANGGLIDLHNIESEQFIVRFEDKLMLHNAVDNIAERITPQNKDLGVGGMFLQRPTEFKSTDLGFMGTQNTDIVSTPYGHIWVDAKRGKIFKIDQNGKGLEIISEQVGNQPTNMKQWFREHLPMKILKQFPQVDTDNKYKGIGFNMWYDNREDRVFITKKDYIVKDTNCLEYDEEKGFYNSCGAYTTTCPTGYTYNSATQLCERLTVSPPICPSGYVYNDILKTCTLTAVSLAVCNCTADALATNAEICSGIQTSIPITSTGQNINFTWTVTQSGVTGATSGSGNSINQVLIGNGTATYTITPQEAVSGCIGTTRQVTATVKPIPNVIATPSSQSINSGEPTNILLTSNVIGATFSWTVVNSGTTGGLAGNGTTILQTLNGTGTTTYSVVASHNGCNSSPTFIAVSVASAVCNFTVGSLHAGGKIIYVDSSGCHGLIVGLSDVQLTNYSTNPGVPPEAHFTMFRPNQTSGQDITSDTLLSGDTNTTNIINKYAPSPHPYAAKAARDYNAGGFTDWYLPSKDELALVFSLRDTIGNFLQFDSDTRRSRYWTSSQSPAIGGQSAWACQFYDYNTLLAGTFLEFPKSEPGNNCKVRAIRKF
jgi:hypothetical protein